VVPGSPAAGATAGLAWLWRLGPVLEAPDRSAVGIGTAAEAAELDELARTGALAGAVVFAPQPDPRDLVLPARRRVSGIAAFESGARVDGDFVVLDGGESVVHSSIGVHAAVVNGRTLVLGADATSAWTLFRQFWILAAIARFLTMRLERALVLLPRVGCVRLDDVPGTAQLQVQGDARSDRRQVRRIRALARAYRDGGGVLNLAVAARALDLDERKEIPLEEHWPHSVAAIAAGVTAGTFELVGHGYLHLNREALRRGEVEKEEFARLGAAEAGRRIDAALEWQANVLGQRPNTFVAPAWAYSDGTLAALADRRLPAWLRPAPAPIREYGVVRETVDSAFRGMRGLSLEPLATLAEFGLPPTPVFHGGLFDRRIEQLRASRDVLSAARLFARRDILRLASIQGVRWIGAGELIRLLDTHDSINPLGAEIDLSTAPEARLLHPPASGVHPIAE
jgi:hypothetical protein